MTPAPSMRHQRLSRRLLTAFENFLKENPLGEVFDAPCDVILSETDVVQPDLLFVSRKRASILTERNVQGPPDLVIEIVSESTRKTDEVIKRKLYEQYGVSEYWVVDPELETVKVYRMTDQGYLRTAELSRETNDFLSTPFLPKFQISLNDLFA